MSSEKRAQKKEKKARWKAYEAVTIRTGNFDHRNVLCHLQVVSPETVKKCGDYNIIAAVAPTWTPVAQPYFNDSMTYLGEKRAWEQYPIRCFEDAVATIVDGEEVYRA